MINKKLATLILSLGCWAVAFAQDPSKSELEQERKRLQQEMQEIQQMYDKAKGQTRQSLGQLNMIARKINLQEKFISNINKELRYIDDDIYLSNLEIYRLQKQLDTLKAEYAKTVVYAYKNRSSYDYVNFIFSANSFNDAVRRIAYLKSYRAYREKQVKVINETRDLIANRQQQQVERKGQKNETLKAQTSEREELAKQKKEKDAVVSKLRANEKDIQKELAQKKKKDRDIQNAIQAIVRREIEAAKKKEADRIAAEKKEADRLAAERKKAEAANPGKTIPAPKEEVAATKPAAKPESYLELNATDVKLGADFASSKGKLPWPLDRHIVLVGYGPYSVDGFKDIKGNNSGLTLGTEVGASVKAVYEGEVAGIHNYGDGAAVVIRHGKYITTYSNLTSVNVTKGARVKTGQVIGKAGPDDTGSGGKLDFMLMIESNTVNPSAWLR